MKVGRTVRVSVRRVYVQFEQCLSAASHIPPLLIARWLALAAAVKAKPRRIPKRHGGKAAVLEVSS